MGKLIPDMKTTIADKCEFPICNLDACTLAYGRDLGVLSVCLNHADQLISVDSPEYTVKCPNCKCYYGVN